MMKGSKGYIYEKSLTLLRSVLWQQQLDLPVDTSEWEEIIKFAAEQTLSGIISDSLSNLPQDSMPPKALKMQMIAMQLQVVQANEHMNAVLLDFTAELAKRDIPYVLMKGQGIASLYPHPLHRVSGDIDLYVPMEYYHTVNKGMLAYGGKRSHETRMHVDYTANGVVWELHHGIYYFQKDVRNVIFNRLMDEAMAEPSVYASVGDGKVRVLPATMNVLLLLAHMLDHFYCAGIGLRQLCDYTSLLDREYANIDKDRLEKALEDLSMIRSYRVMGALCVRHLGLPSDRLMLVPSNADNKLADAIMRDCLRGGNFGRSDHPGRSTVGKWLCYYVRFMWRLVKFRNLCPSEALWWPLAKLYRLFTGTVHISEEKSVLNKNS